MSNQDKKQGELTEEQLEGVAGGQEVKKMGTIVVEAKRLPAESNVLKMETITVCAAREKPEVNASVQTAGVQKKKS